MKEKKIKILELRCITRPYEFLPYITDVFPGIDDWGFHFPDYQPNWREAQQKCADAIDKIKAHIDLGFDIVMVRNDAVTSTSPPSRRRKNKDAIISMGQAWSSWLKSLDSSMPTNGLHGCFLALKNMTVIPNGQNVHAIIPGGKDSVGNNLTYIVYKGCSPNRLDAYLASFVDILETIKTVIDNGWERECRIEMMPSL